MDIVASWSLPVQILVGVAALLALVGLFVGVRWVLRHLGPGRRRRYPDQPTVPVLFEPRSRAGGADGRSRSDDWQPRQAERSDRSGLIGRRHGPTPEDRRSPSRSQIRVAEAESESAPSAARAERRASERSDEGADASPSERSRPAPAPSPTARRPAPHPPRPRREPAVDEDDEDHTLQLLPGRMEIVAGGDLGREIRFIRVPENSYTFGRKGDSDPGHFQLANATVSREHAAMRHVNGRWRIRNLSRTNPVRINGELADTPGKEYTLHDGDRIEMGEVAFLFREK